MSFEYLVNTNRLHITPSAATGNRPRKTVSRDNEEGRRQKQQQGRCAAGGIESYTELSHMERHRWKAGQRYRVSSSGAVFTWIILTELDLLKMKE